MGYQTVTMKSKVALGACLLWLSIVSGGACTSGHDAKLSSADARTTWPPLENATLVDRGHSYPHNAMLPILAADHNGTVWLALDIPDHPTSIYPVSASRLRPITLPTGIIVERISWNATGVAWISDFGGRSIVRISADQSERVVNPKDTRHFKGRSKEPFRITMAAAAPNGTAWFAMREEKMLGSMSEFGTFRAIPLPVTPDSVVVDGNSNVWFLYHPTYLNGFPKGPGGIGVLRRNGAVQFFPSWRFWFETNPPTVGPRGTIWLGSACNSILRVTPRNKIEVTQLARSLEYCPTFVAPDNQNGAWFAAEKNWLPAVGHIDEAGRLRMFLAPPLRLMSVAVDKDGMVWIAGAPGSRNGSNLYELIPPKELRHKLDIATTPRP